MTSRRDNIIILLLWFSRECQKRWSKRKLLDLIMGANIRPP